MAVVNEVSYTDAWCFKIIFYPFAFLLFGNISLLFVAELF
jgi:hypothetical protein